MPASTPSTAVSADGPLNIYNAVGVAVDPNAKGRGVLVVMNDWIHAAHSLTKTSTTAIQTFMSPLRGVVGVATYGKNDFYNTPQWKHTSASERGEGSRCVRSHASHSSSSTTLE